MQKTNVMRVLDQRKIPYEAHFYPHGGEAVDAESVAALIGRDSRQVFKTLVARGASRACFVFVIPAGRELDLKKAAHAAGEKSMAMLRLNELTPSTGYVRGGCSPIGMKKQYPTFLDCSAREMTHIVVSAGKIGAQVELAPDDLLSLIRGSYEDLVIED